MDIISYFKKIPELVWFGLFCGIAAGTLAYFNVFLPETISMLTIALGLSYGSGTVEPLMGILLIWTLSYFEIGTLFQRTVIGLVIIFLYEQAKPNLFKQNS